MSKHDGRPPGLAFSPLSTFDGARLLVANGKDVWLWDAVTGKELARFQGHTEPVRAVMFSPDGKHVLSGSGRGGDLGNSSTDNSARMWDVSTSKEIQRFEGHEGYVHTVQFSPDGKQVLTASRDSTSRLWDPDTGRVFREFSDICFTPPAATFSPDGLGILVLRVGGQGVTLWYAASGKALLTLERGKGTYESAVFDPAGTVILTASSDGAVRTWDVHSGRGLRVFSGHTGSVHQAMFTAGGRTVVTASSDGTVRFWDAETANEVGKIEYPGSVWQILVNEDGKRVLAHWRAEKENRITRGITLSASETGHEILQQTSDDAGEVVGFSPDGKQLLEVQLGKPVGVRDAGSGKVIKYFK